MITGLLTLTDYIFGAENETLRALWVHTNRNIEMRSPSAAAMMTMVVAATIVRFPPVDLDERFGYCIWRLALSGHWLSGAGCLHLLCVWYDYCMEYCFYIYPPPLDASAQGHSFWTTDWIICYVASIISNLHAKLRIIGRRVPGFATGSHCGVWGRGWTTCLLYDGPLLGLFFKMTVCVEF